MNNKNYLWELLNLTENFNYKDVDDAYNNIKDKTKDVEFAWKVLRDKQYSEIYKKYLNFEIIEKAGFIQNELMAEDINFYNIDLLSTPFSKILNNIENREVENPVVLLTTGGFCPLHEGHFHMMEIAKNTLEENGYNVIGGYFSPSHEAYVSTKPYYNTDKYKRLELCQSVVESHSWLMIDPWESTYVKTYINFTDVYHRLELYLRKYINNNIKVAYVCGGDNVNFMYCFENSGLGICINRINSNEEFEFTKKQINSKNVFFIDNNSDTKSLSSRYIRKIEEKRISNKNYSGSYIVRNEDILPLSSLKKLTTTTKLKIAQRKFLNDFIYLLKNIFYDQINVNTIDIKKQIKKAKEELKDKQTISLDPYYKGTYNLKVSRMFDISDTQKRYISLVGRLGYETIEEQVNNINSGNYILVDDDSVTGKTLNNIMSYLPESIQIEEIYLLSSMFKNKVFDVVDLRDFIIGAENSGLVVRLPNLDVIRVPYVFPYVSLQSRANVKAELEIEFSIKIWDMNKEFYNQINQDIKLSQVNSNFKNLMNLIGFEDDTLIIDICDWHINKLKEIRE